MQRQWRYFKCPEKVDYVIKSSDTNRIWGKLGLLSKLEVIFKLQGLYGNYIWGKGNYTTNSSFTIKGYERAQTCSRVIKSLGNIAEP